MLGALLAGGASRRAGVDKATIRHGDTTLAATMLALLDTVAAEVVVLGHGRGVDPARVRLDDPAGMAGPFAGLVAAVRFARARGVDTLLIAPIDMPALTPPLLARLLAARGTARALLGPDGRLHALPLALDVAAAAATLEALAARGERSLLAVLGALGAVAVPLARDEGDALANRNAIEADPRLAAARSSEVLAARHGRGGTLAVTERVAIEEPLQIMLASLPLAVVMRTPGDDAALVRGFVVTEGIVPAAAIAGVEPCEAAAPGSASWRVALQPGVRVDPSRLERRTYVGSSCGVCGKASIEQVMRTAAPPPSGPPLPASALVGVAERLRGGQPLFAATGGSHAAALFDRAGALAPVFEDVGRHNACDKAIGAALAAGGPADALAAGLVVSGRISFEIVQKAIAVGIPVVAGVSAPTSLAVALAHDAGVGLVGFARSHRWTVYACPSRIAADASGEAR